ncbi:MAG: shikimate dehydrogenase [Terriglobales bacterium]
MVPLTATARGAVSNRIAPGRLPRTCVPVAAETVAELLAKAERAAREAALIELRLDGIKQWATVAAPLRAFLRSSPQTFVIATCRKQAYGGKFSGSIKTQFAALRQAAAAGCAAVDLELQSAERLPSSALSELRQHANLIVSYHDFHTTPALAPLWERLRAVPADIYKLVTTAKTWRHNLEMLRFVEAHSGAHPLVGFCMGEMGLLSRVLSLRAGAAFTFAALEAGEATAPGQPVLQQMRVGYRAEELNRATAIYGILGYPLVHSLSPRMHAVAYRRLGMNAVYLPLLSRKPSEVLELAAEVPLQGISVTHPYKSEILALLERVDPLGAAVGAVNTIVRSQGKFYGYNTDVAGVLEPLGQALPLRGAKILVLGAGGAARAAVFGLRSQGAHVSIFNRSRPRAEALAKAAKAKVVKRADLKKLEWQAIVHATPVGQYPNERESLLASDEIHAPVVFDLVYNPRETELLRRAQAAGAQTISGAEMLVVQGARQFELWTGKPAPMDIMRSEVLAALSEPAAPED